MPRLGLDDLPQPSPGYFITRLAAPPPDAMGYTRQAFETADSARREDRLRVLLCESASLHLPNSRKARRLARRLRSARTPKTLASSRRWRRLRIRLIGALWKLVVEGSWDQTQPGQVAVVSVAPRSWEFTPAQLEGTCGDQLIARLRSWLNRAGVAEADGFLVACLHGEFVPGRGVYRVHAHGVAAGGMIRVVDELRDLPDLDSKLDRPDGREHAPPRIFVSRKPLTDLPHSISYQFKGWWPSRWIGVIKATGETKRARWASRIRNPEHTELLLWFDRHQLSDITLLMKVRVGKQGLVPTHQSRLRSLIDRI